LTGGLAACGGEEGETESSASADGPPPAAAQPPGGNPPPAPTNSAPSIGGTPPSQVLVGDSFDFTPTAVDADGDVLTFSVQNRPAWASFDQRTGRLSGTPREQDAGAYTDIRLSVTDGAADASLSPFTI